jgi:hypothetical protein
MALPVRVVSYVVLAPIQRKCDLVATNGLKEYIAVNILFFVILMLCSFNPNVEDARFAGFGEEERKEKGPLLQVDWSS